MEFISTLDLVFIKDCILIGLCALCALYCLLLSKRLRAFSDIRKGVGASIVSLTEAIETTHQASQAVRRDINISISEMQDLITQADSRANTLEARLAEIRRIETSQQPSQFSLPDDKSIQRMQKLVDQADDKADILETRLVEIKRNVKTASQVAHALNNVIDLKAPLALNQIRDLCDQLAKLAEENVDKNLHIIESKVA